MKVNFTHDFLKAILNQVQYFSFSKFVFMDAVREDSVALGGSKEGAQG